MIKALLLDYDGVVSAPVPDGTAAQRLARNLGISFETAAEWIGSIWAPLLKGEVSEDDVWRVFEEKYGKPINTEQRDIWFKWEELQPLPEVIALVRELKSKGYPVGILSNATPSTIAEIRENGGYDEFDFVVLSSEVGLKKPEPAMFNYALRQLKSVSPDEVLFLDDRQHNTDAASQLGMKTIFAKSPQQAINDIKLLLKW